MSKIHTPPADRPELPEEIDDVPAHLCRKTRCLAQQKHAVKRAKKSLSTQPNTDENE